MNEDVYYDFCPKCGALMRQGVCQSCEFTVNVSREYIEPQYKVPQANAVQPEKKSKTGLIVGLIIGGIALMLIVVAIVAIAVWSLFNNISALGRDEYRTEEDGGHSYDYDYREDDLEQDEFSSLPDMTIQMPDAEGDTWDDIWDVTTEENGRIDLDGDGIGDLEFELGEEGLNAEYYPLITDYIRYDLEYSVYFMEYSNGDNSVKCVYPQLEGNKKSINYINQFLCNFAEETEVVASNNACNAKSEAYVTYMDENLISIVFVELYTKTDNSNFEYIYCYTFDMSGEEFKVIEFELTDTSDGFIDALKTRCLEQSTSDADYLFSTYTKEEIRNNIITADYGLVAFYTPLGMEIGLNYDGYWCCATFKDYADYIRVVTNAETGMEF